MALHELLADRCHRLSKLIYLLIYIIGKPFFCMFLHNLILMAVMITSDRHGSELIDYCGILMPLKISLSMYLNQTCTPLVWAPFLICDSIVTSEELCFCIGLNNFFLYKIYRRSVFYWVTVNTFLLFTRVSLTKCS